MLKDKTSSAIVAISDLERARDFYTNTLGRGVHRRDGFAAIWFKDPDGNILHVHSM